MKLQAFITLISAANISHIPSMLQFLDGMETHYVGGDSKFNRVFLNDVTECLGMFDDDVLLKS